MKAKRWITHNLGLKILALVLAIATWFYISQELTKLKNEEERAIIDMLHYKVISKKLPVQLMIVGEARKEYKVIMENVTVQPETIIVIGPKNILDEVNYARTVPIDISEYTKDINKDIALAPIARGIRLKNTFVKVFIPIAKEPKKETEKVSE